MILNDAVEVAGVRQSKDGYWIADCRAAKGGNVQMYAGAEVGRPDLPTVAVYRPRDEVFREASLASYAHKPVTLGHPSQSVNPSTWRDVAVGAVGGDVLRDGDTVRVSLALMDADAIEAVRDGLREISMGYECRIEFADGQTEDGTPYQAIQRDLRINHAAIVPKGRAGPECRIGDAGAAATPNTPPTTRGERAVPDDTRAVVLDGLTIRTNDAGAEAIARLQRQITDAATAADAQRAEHGRTIQARDGQIQALRDEAARAAEAHQGAVAALTATHQQALDALRGEVDALRVQTSDAALDARVAARSALIAQARRILGDAYDATGQSDAAIRRAVVSKALPTLPMDDSKGDAYVTAAFDAVMAAPTLSAPAQAQPDPLRLAIAGGTQTQDSDPRRTAYQEYVHFLENAHRAGKEG